MLWKVNYFASSLQIFSQNQQILLKKWLIFMILANFYQTFLPKYKIWSDPKNCFFCFCFFFLLIACSKFAPKSIHQMYDSSANIHNFPAFQASTPPCACKRAIGTDVPPNHTSTNVEEGSTPLHVFIGLLLCCQDIMILILYQYQRNEHNWKSFLRWNWTPN